jgi:hypothetical protein
MQYNNKLGNLEIYFFLLLLKRNVVDYYLMRTCICITLFFKQVL